MITLHWDPDVYETETALQTALAKHQHVLAHGPGWSIEYIPARDDMVPGFGGLAYYVKRCDFTGEHLGFGRFLGEGR